MIYTYVATALLSAVMAFGSAWKIQNWRADAKEKEHAEQTLDIVRQSAAADIRRLDNRIRSADAAVAREVVLRRDAAGARVALVGLSGATEQAMRAAQTTHAACLERANAISVVLGQCAGRYTGLAATADRIASDREALIDGWPTDSK